MDILIVENASSVTRMLEIKFSKKHEVRVAENVKQALAEIQQKLPDLVILDLRLNGPTHSGLDVYNYLRGELGERTPIIFLTGLADTVDLYQRADKAVQADRLGGVYTKLFVKPVPLKILGSEINKLEAAA